MNSLKNANAAGRLAHSYLLSSSNPDFRLSFPPVLACLAACPTPKQDGAPCESCSTCRQIMTGIYPDLYTLSPISKSREITIGKDSGDPDTLRSFEAAFHLSSTTESGWKIGVIQDADTMNENAQNAFLKTLEEPPKKCFFILSTGHVSQLLPTIRSRCQFLALTDNRCEYDLARFSEVPGILMKLQFHSRNDIVAAEECTQALLTILGSLQDEAKKLVAAKWEERLEMAKNLESAGMKLLEKRIAGEEGCEYRRLREQFISLLHTWFAQIALLAENTGREFLPNPEVLEPFFNTEPQPELNSREAFRTLAETESLLRSLRTNVSDELAIRSFCLSVAIL